MRYPLYEALNAAYDALANAKSSRPEKNAIAVDLQKHSGQTMKLCIAKEGFPLFRNILQQVLQQNDEAVNSVIYVLNKFTPSIYCEAKDQRTKNINVFINNYDNESQKKYLPYIQTIAGLFCDFLESGNLITAQDVEGSAEVKCFENILRIGKFFVEGGSENA